MTLLCLGDHPDLDRQLVGGKAASINRMMTMGLSVPPAFVLTTETCREFQRAGGRLDESVVADIEAGVAALEARTGRTFGSPTRGLLVSVRSGAARSMPGMMDTILNLGMNEDVEDALALETDDPTYAADTHRRFVEQFEDVVGEKPPRDPWQQLLAAVAAVFRSWDAPRATRYREHYGIAHDGGTAVTVQAMVFGNLDDRSGTGVLFTRNPLTGAREPFGEWVPRGQGEDVVSGRFDPQGLESLGDLLPAVHEELLEAGRTLEREYGDVQDVEFTVEAGRLWLLQTRSAKRSPDAAARLAVELHEDGIVSQDEALRRLTPDQVDALLRPRVHPEAVATAELVAEGQSACPGVASGVVVTDVDEAERLAASGRDVVLARPTTDPDDVPGMLVAAAVLTEVGGATSHAAVVSREIPIPCVVGCGRDTVTRLDGEVVTVDAAAGVVYRGQLPTAPCSEDEHEHLAVLGAWARERLGEADADLRTLLDHLQTADR